MKRLKKLFLVCLLVSAVGLTSFGFDCFYCISEEQCGQVAIGSDGYINCEATHTPYGWICSAYGKQCHRSV